MFFYSVAFLAVFLDQLIKFIVERSLAVNQSLPLLGHALKLTYVRNTGAAFSLFVGFSPYLAIIGIIVSAAVIYLHYRVPAKNYLFQAGLALILGGSLGNLADRLFRSYVVDYLDLSFWPVFNLADILINAGVLLLAYALFARREKDASGPA